MLPPGANYMLAIQRFYIAICPEFAETQWRRAHEFRALPEDQRQAGHWYAYKAGNGFIHVDENLNGEYVPELPADVDPAQVIPVPALLASQSLLDEFLQRIEQAPSGARAKLKALADRLGALASPGQAISAVISFGRKGIEAQLAGRNMLLKYLSQSSEAFLGDKLMDATVTGQDAAGVLLIDKIAHAVAESFAKQQNAGLNDMPAVMLRMFSPGPGSLEQLAVRFAVDCATHGFAMETLATLDAIWRTARDQIGEVRGTRITMLGEPEMSLTFYYGGLFQNAPFIRAAMIGYQALVAIAQTQKLPSRIAKEANVAEEMLVRSMDALFFSVRDADGSERRVLRAHLQALRESGRNEAAQARISEVIDLKLFLPSWFRPMIMEPQARSPRF